MLRRKVLSSINEILKDLSLMDLLAIRKALNNYRGKETPEDDFKEQIIELLNNVDDRTVRIIKAILILRK